MIQVKEQSMRHTLLYELTQHLFFNNNKSGLKRFDMWTCSNIDFFSLAFLQLFFFSNSRQILSLQTSKDMWIFQSNLTWHITYETTYTTQISKENKGVTIPDQVN